MKPRESQYFHQPRHDLGDFRIALVSMPFVSIDKPSIQIGLLKAIARSHGVETTNFELSLDFARQIGTDLYAVLANHRGHLFGDWLFSAAAFDHDAPDGKNRFLSDFHSEIAELLAPRGKAAECLRRLREIEVPRYLCLLMETIPWGNFRVIGFTSTLSSHVLDLMRKGVSAIQNVNLLRWAAYYKLCVVWNLIWGFPGETEEDYIRQAELIPHLAHLQPPLSSSRIWMERFSPIFFDRELFPARTVRAEASYAYVYPEFVDRERVAYFFDYEFENSLPDSVYTPVVHEAQNWQEAWRRTERPRLTFRSSREFLQIEDRRSCTESLSYTLSGPLASLYAGCSDQPQSPGTLRKKVGVDWSESKIEKTLHGICSQGLMMSDGGLYLSLAIPTSPDSDIQRA